MCICEREGFGIKRGGLRPSSWKEGGTFFKLKIQLQEELNMEMLIYTVLQLLYLYVEQCKTSGKKEILKSSATFSMVTQNSFMI